MNLPNETTQMRAYTIPPYLSGIPKFHRKHCPELSVHLRVCDPDSTRGWQIILALTDAGEVGTMSPSRIIRVKEGNDELCRTDFSIRASDYSYIARVHCLVGRCDNAEKGHCMGIAIPPERREGYWISGVVDPEVSLVLSIVLPVDFSCKDLVANSWRSI